MDLLDALLRLCDKPSVTQVTLVIHDRGDLRIFSGTSLHKCPAWERLAAAHGISGSNTLLLDGMYCIWTRGRHADWFAGALSTARSFGGVILSGCAGPEMMKAPSTMGSRRVLRMWTQRTTAFEVVWGGPCIDRVATPCGRVYSSVSSGRIGSRPTVRQSTLEPPPASTQAAAAVPVGVPRRVLARPPGMVAQSAGYSTSLKTHETLDYRRRRHLQNC